MMPRTRPPSAGAEHPDPVPPLEAGLGLRARVAGDALVGVLDRTSVPSSAGSGRDADAALLVVHADAGRRPPGRRCSRPRAARRRRRCGASPSCVARRDRLGQPVGGERRPAPRSGPSGARGSAGRPAQRMAAAPRPEPEAHANGEAPPGLEAPRDGGGGLERRRLAPHGNGGQRAGGRRSAAAAAAPAPRPAAITGRKRTARPKAAMPIPTSISVMMPSATVGT